MVLEKTKYLVKVDLGSFTQYHWTSPRFSSVVRRLFSTCWSRGTSESSTYGKQRICLSNSWSAHFHVLWLSDFIFYQKPLYKSLHQSFFYSFVTILPSESGVTPQSVQTKDYKIGICCFSTKQAALRLVQNQDNVSECADMSICRMLFQRNSTIKIQLSMLV